MDLRRTHERDYVIDHLAELVVKPIDGSVASGSSSVPKQRPKREGASAGTAVPARTFHRPGDDCPVHPSDVRRGRHVPPLCRPARLRAPAGLTGMDGVKAEVMPAALTRVAAQGSRIVNSSSGGGSKDTWIGTGGIYTGGHDHRQRPRGNGTQCVVSAARSASTVESADVAAISRMTDAMESRGPDPKASSPTDPSLSDIGGCRSSTCPPRGAQPMVDSDLGLTLVFNGCIYNYEACAPSCKLSAIGSSPGRQRSGHRGFHRWGTDCVNRFKGMFAFAIADLATGVVALAATDSGSSRCTSPRQPGRLRFASTIRAVLRRRRRRRRARSSRAAPLLEFSFGGARTANHVFAVCADCRRLRCASSRPTALTPTPSTGHRFSSGTRRAGRGAVPNGRTRCWMALRTAVFRRMVADVPVGVLLSGGIDSSLVVALLAEQGQHGLATFRIGFDAVGGESATSTATRTWWPRPRDRPSPHSHR